MVDAVIVHGSIRRRSTMVWMADLARHLEEDGIAARRFVWSGVPLRSFVRRAATELRQQLAGVDLGRTAIICKSVGADIVNLAFPHPCFGLVIRIAPAYVVSRELLGGQPAVTLSLARDRFLDFWTRVGMVHRLEHPPEGAHYVIDNSEELDHHAINWNREVSVSGVGQVWLYEFYQRLIAETVQPAIRRRTTGNG